MSRLSIIPALVATATVACAHQGVSLPRLEPCGNATAVVECGQLIVHERPHDVKSRQLSLGIVRIRRDPAPAATATFVLAGGPGSAATEMARGDIADYEEWAAYGDVVFIDQRGTEAGSPLRCGVAADFDPFNGIFQTDALSRCRDEAARVIDLASYGTEDAASDIETARATLGYDQISFAAAYALDIGCVVNAPPAKFPPPASGA